MPPAPQPRELGEYRSEDRVITVAILVTAVVVTVITAIAAVAAAAVVASTVVPGGGAVGEDVGVVFPALQRARRTVEKPPPAEGDAGRARDRVDDRARVRRAAQGGEARL